MKTSINVLFSSSLYLGSLEVKIYIHIKYTSYTRYTHVFNYPCLKEDLAFLWL